MMTGGDHGAVVKDVVPGFAEGSPAATRASMTLAAGDDRLGPLDEVAIGSRTEHGPRRRRFDDERRERGGNGNGDEQHGDRLVFGRDAGYRDEQ
jgi:hypothetical protein